MTESQAKIRPSEFIESVLALQPEIAVFDCDGTLWRGDAGRDFFYWEIERGIVSRKVAENMRERYRLYEAGTVDERTMCGEMVTMHDGIAVENMYHVAEEFFDEVIAPRIFLDMLELTRRLAASGCELWAVSSTNNWVVEVGAKCFGFPPDKVLAACVHTEAGIATGRLHRVPTDELKATAIREVIGKPMHSVFGNSIHDQAMLELARHPYAVNPNPDLHEVAKLRNWTIYWPNGARP